MSTLELQQKAAAAAQARCESDATPYKFDELYRRECYARHVDPNELDSPAQFCPACGCRSCQRVREMQRIRGGISRLDEETEQLSRRMTHETWGATFEFDRQQRAASAAQQRCEDEAKPERFNRYYREELKRA